MAVAVGKVCELKQGCRETRAGIRCESGGVDDALDTASGIGHADPENAARHQNASAFLQKGERNSDRKVFQQMLMEDSIDRPVRKRQRTSKIPHDVKWPSRT